MRRRPRITDLDLAVSDATRELDRVLSAITDQADDLREAVGTLQHVIDERRRNT